MKARNQTVCKKAMSLILMAVLMLNIGASLTIAETAVINTSMIRTTLQCLASGRAVPDDLLWLMDADGDGTVTTSDVRVRLRQIVSESTEAPAFLVDYQEYGGLLEMGPITIVQTNAQWDQMTDLLGYPYVSFAVSTPGFFDSNAVIVLRFYESGYIVTDVEVTNDHVRVITDQLATDASHTESTHVVLIAIEKSILDHRTVESAFKETEAAKIIIMEQPQAAQHYAWNCAENYDAITVFENAADWQAFLDAHTVHGEILPSFETVDEAFFERNVMVVQTFANKPHLNLSAPQLVMISDKTVLFTVTAQWGEPVFTVESYDHCFIPLSRKDYTRQDPVYGVYNQK